MQELNPEPSSTVRCVNEIAVIREGEGPEVLLVHGGASPTTTWGALSALSSRWTLAFVHRRGYPPSPAPPGGRQDFDVDASDLIPLLEQRPHVVAHSYGALGTLIAAAQRPECVRSMTLIEPPIYLVPGDPEVARLEAIGNAVLTHGLETDPAMLRDFLSLAGAPVGHGPLPEEVAGGVRRAHGGRLPGEANLALDALREAGIPSLVASGDHSPALERICDALAATLDAERLIAPGRGHFVAAAPGFADRLERFLISVGERSLHLAPRD
jgi:pimeloyl-ACP methyl ester carboxylesterase